MSDMQIFGIDLDELDQALDRGQDIGGNPIVAFTDDEGGKPLRCCMQRSEPGDQLALIAWSPFRWQGPYAETGPIFVHTDGCPGQPETDRLSEMVETGPMTLRPYSHDRRIDYGRVRHIPAGESLAPHLQALLDDPAVDFVHGRNSIGGCYAFEARRPA